MGEIILYSTKCSKCMVIETKLKQLHSNFQVVEDIDTVIAVGKANKINTAPILKVGDKYYDFAGAIKFLNTI